MEKTCKKCEVTKPLTSFYRHDGNKDGYESRCKDCANESKKTKKHAPSCLIYICTCKEDK